MDKTSDPLPQRHGLNSNFQCKWKEIYGVTDITCSECSRVRNKIICNKKISRLNLLETPLISRDMALEFEIRFAV